MFVWQFPHFLSIAWLYREDYAQGDIRMLPVVDSNGKSTVWRILAYSAALIPVSVLPVAMGMAGRVYFVGAILMGAMLFRVSMAMATPQLPATAPASKLARPAPSSGNHRIPARLVRSDDVERRTLNLREQAGPPKRFSTAL